MDLTQNYFELLDVPESFDVDAKQLTHNYRQLQRQFHPDKFAGKTDAEQRLSEQFSAYLNAGYRTLKSSVLRGEYLLSLAGQAVDKDTLTIADSLFLLKQMAWREQLADIAADPSRLDELQPLQKQADDERETLLDSFKSFYQQQDYSSATQAIAKLHFVEKFKIDLDELEEKFF